MLRLAVSLYDNAASSTHLLKSRPHRQHAVHRCGLLLQMSHVAWSVCVGYTGELSEKTAVPIEMPFGELNHVGPRKTVY